MIKAFWIRLFGNKIFKNTAETRVVRFALFLENRPSQVAIAGSFNCWSCLSHPLRLSASGFWETTLQLAPGTYRYRFLVNNSTWVLDPSAEAASNQYGGTDSILLVQPLDAAPLTENILAEEEQCV